MTRWSSVVRGISRLWAVGSRPRRLPAVSTVILSVGLLVLTTMAATAWMNYSTILGDRADLDPMISQALSAGLIGYFGPGGTPNAPAAYVIGPNGNMDVNLSQLGTNTLQILIAMNGASSAQQGNLAVPCATLTPIGLGATNTATMQQSCTNATLASGAPATASFAWEAPIASDAGQLLDSDANASTPPPNAAIIVSQIQVATDSPYQVTLFGDTITEPQPTLAAEVWIPVTVNIFGFPVALAITDPIVIPLAVSSNGTVLAGGAS